MRSYCSKKNTKSWWRRSLYRHPEGCYGVVLELIFLHPSRISHVGLPAPARVLKPLAIFSTVRNSSMGVTNSHKIQSVVQGLWLIEKVRCRVARVDRRIECP